MWLSDIEQQWIIQHKDFYSDETSFNAFLDETIAELGIDSYSNILRFLLLDANVNILEFLKATPLQVFKFSDIHELHIPANCSVVSEYSFSHCNELSSVQFDEGVEKLLPGCFQYCNISNPIIFPKSLQRIESWAFHLGIHPQTTLTFLNPDTLIRDTAFNECENLRIKCYKDSNVDHFFRTRNLIALDNSEKVTLEYM